MAALQGGLYVLTPKRTFTVAEMDGFPLNLLGPERSQTAHMSLLVQQHAHMMGKNGSKAHPDSMQQAVNDLFVSSAVGGLSENLMLLLRFVKLNRKSPVLHPNQPTDFECFIKN